MTRRALPPNLAPRLSPRLSFRRERALLGVAERGLQVAEALADQLGNCKTTAETLRLAEAFSQLSEEVCGAIALEAELRRERESRERELAKAAGPAAEGPLRPRMH